MEIKEQKARYKALLNEFFSHADAYSEKYRLGYHFSPPVGWMNDPNGLCYYNGEYHLYFQHIFPVSDTEWSPMGWGHTSTIDFKTYTYHPMAIHADDAGMAWSGSCVVDTRNTSGQFDENGGLVAAYTYTQYQTYWQKQNMAYSVDGINFTPEKSNPVLPNTDFIQDFRDPKVFYHEPTKKWIMAVAGGTARFYGSDDLKHWHFLSKNEALFSECPDLFPLAADGDRNNMKWVYILGGRFHQQKKCAYCIGTFDGTSYTVESGPFDLNCGTDIYAPQSFSNTGEKVLWLYWMDFWTNKNRPYQHQSALYELSLKTVEGVGIRLIQTPSSLLHTLREKEFKAENVVLNENGYIPDFTSNQLELQATLRCESGSFKIEFFKSEHETVVFEYHKAENTFILDRSRGGNKAILENSPQTFTAPLLRHSNEISLTVLADKGSLEIFINGGETVLTALSYPDENGKTLSFSALGNTVLEKLKVYQLGSIRVKKSEAFE